MCTQPNLAIKMSTFTDIVDVEEGGIHIESLNEFLQAVNANFKEEMNSLSDRYTESVTDFLQVCASKGIDQENNDAEGRKTDEAMECLLQRALKLVMQQSQALKKKYIELQQMYSELRQKLNEGNG